MVYMWTGTPSLKVMALGLVGRHGAGELPQHNFEIHPSLKMVLCMFTVLVCISECVHAHKACR